MLVIGLTGGIGMGKSTAAKILRGFGLPVYNADRIVHHLLGKGGKAVKPVARLFPEALKRNAIDRDHVARLVFGHPARLKKLVKIIHPLVWQEEKLFMQKARAAKAPAAILEIPLLFETGGQKRCDVVICVTAPRAIQKARVVKRPGMTSAKFKAILKHQMPDKQKCARADYVVQTGKGYADTKKQLRLIMDWVLPYPQPHARNRP